MVSVVKALGPMILRMAKEEKNEESRKNYISITMQYNTKRIQSSIQYSSIAQNQKALIVHLDFPSTDGRVRQWPFVKLKLAAESNLYSN